MTGDFATHRKPSDGIQPECALFSSKRAECFDGYRSADNHKLPGPDVSERELSSRASVLDADLRAACHGLAKLDCQIHLPRGMAYEVQGRAARGKQRCCGCALPQSGGAAAKKFTTRVSIRKGPMRPGVQLQIPREVSKAVADAPGERASRQTARVQNRTCGRDMARPVDVSGEKTHIECRVVRHGSASAKKSEEIRQDLIN